MKLAASLFIVACFVLLSIPAFGEDSSVTNEDCLSCHNDPELTKEITGQKPVSLFIDEQKFKSSTHGDLDCISCHSDISEVPHSESLQKVDCGSCHEQESQDYVKSTHGKAHATGNGDAPECITCHGKHDILPPSNFQSKTHPLHQIEICTSCHLNPELAQKYNLPPKEKIESYKTSIHGRGVLRSGLLVSATCVSCHGAHKILPKNNPESSIYWSKIPESCGKCHLGILEDFTKSEHGKVWSRRSPQGPGCVTCHGSHSIQDPVSPEFQIQIPLLCARCHEKEAPTYQDTFHGEAVSLGFIRSATCADCHTPHRNLKASDPASTVNKNNVLQTCGKCHVNANQSFVTYDPHVDLENKSAHPLFYYVYHGMVFLLYSVFGFFGIHTLLWLQRSIIGYFRGEFEKHRNGNGPWVERFSPKVRLLHGFIIVSFLGLAFTGLPLRFHYAAWAVVYVNLLGGLEVFRYFHRFFALITFGYAFYHIATIFKTGFLKREIGIFYGPKSMVPRIKDFADLYSQVKWFLYLGKPAKLDRWTYWEKFDYFAVFWGIPVIGISGLLLWFPGFFTTFLPGYVLNLAKIIHSEEALLAAGFIFTVHFFHTHLRPESFPMDLVIFTGKMPLERFKTERPEEYERLVKAGELEKYLVEPPTQQMKRFSYIVGSIALTIGIGLILAIITAVLFYA